MRVEVNTTGKAPRFGAAMPAEAVGEQVARLNQSSNEIKVGLGLLKDAVVDLLAVNREVLGALVAARDHLFTIAVQMDDAVRLLEELDRGSARLQMAMDSIAVDLRANTDEMRRGSARS